MIKLLKKLKPFWISVIALLFLAFFQSMADLYLPTLMSDIVNNGISKVNSKGVSTPDVPYIWQTGGKMILVTAGSMICAILVSLLASKITMGLTRNIRKELFTRVESYSMNEFDKIGTSSLITRTTNDITQVQNVVIMMLRMLITAPMMSIGGLILALQKDRKLTIVLAVAIPFLAIVIGIMGRIVVPYFKVMQKKIDKINLVLREGLTGIRVIRAFDRQEIEKERFAKANADYTNLAIRANKIMAGLMPIMMFVMNLTSISIIWFGAKRIDAGSMQVGDMMAFTQYAMQIMISVLMVAVMFVLIPRAQASAVRINEVLDMKPEIEDPKNPEKSAEDKKGYVEFKNVSFSYPGAEELALSNISFSAKPGETTAIIGGTGSGKSTLINLIPRFYEASDGEILVDGKEIKKMTQNELRSKIGFVPQKAILFSGDITSNIEFGNDNANFEDIKHAAEIAQATEFISNMKDGFESEIAEGGSNVSGGQKQRLSIARALVKRPEIYIFDDSFSALDFKTDAKLRAALSKETQNSTVIIVAQRVSTIMNADRIIVLDEGKVVGIGTHKELLNNCDVYHEIVASQLSEEEMA
ncbi:ATP-binding cassette subfamily B protein [Clostridium acetobutylicum]|uniref:ABC-type multidrug/protein/lipid transport system, ATPase component n=1 Tax=Clostridium acetobutylicum (strain ATCC 824 / DSM 792 / JCM 1419 / IAM 19013 / LMG 5710 / NBRC 13948 / NRRL B-527 / VKM B-1787 / 2291 / W) TaxID=272562 RepID=Q97E34_CLOAB|nr:MULTISPECIES: ABC transporter ATP-binding protein [Clostridium]AAK81216.1 ABC-type multidrug/protein/lipid transport system, ATPase component [Clostridium acetobutylicum ATCC 824]ADZ22321.1 ABC-type multidrug/protein/lipid transport system, ATPase component [Clostridium acetobutylicum EA 2018]AEI34376.1 ABC-type multidrug/protein/lipid transport system, ATPase component [Clostridium acetobutylicum DSM 1731]AWV81116.1 ABC transporter ATP-binding protein [Clostridium acetobutylicum]MBC2395683